MSDELDAVGQTHPVVVGACPPELLSGKVEVDRGVIKPCLDSKRPRMDPVLFGHGLKIDHKWVPHRANPKHKPPLTIKSYADDDRRRRLRREYRHLGPREQREHLKGQRPCFALNSAQHRRWQWDPQRLADVLHRFMPASDSVSLVALLETHRELLSGKDLRGRGNVIRLTPNKAFEFLQATPGTARKLARKLRDDDPWRWVKLHLLNTFKFETIEISDGSKIRVRNPAYWQLRRALRHAMLITLVPILTHELVVDIDKVDGFSKSQQRTAARELAARIVAEVFQPLGWPVFVEVSRNRKGMYIRFRVQRSSNPTEFNSFIGQFQRYLRQTYNQDRCAAKVDKVGGRLLYFFENPEFDPDLYEEQPEHSTLTHGEWYEWTREHHGIGDDDGPPPAWTYDPRLEPIDYAGGDLITMPLHNLNDDEDGGKDRQERYHRFARTDPLAESMLRSVIPHGSGSDEVATDADDCTETIEGTASKKPVSARGSGNHCRKTQSALGRGPAGIDQAIFDDEGMDSFARYGAAARRCLRELVTDPNDDGQVEQAVQAMLAMVEADNGPADGLRHEERVKRVRRIIDYWLTTFDAQKVSSKRRATNNPHDGTGKEICIWLCHPDENPVHLDDLEWCVRWRISRLWIDEANRRFKADTGHRQLAWALGAYMKNIHTEKIGEVPRDAVKGFLRNNGVEATNEDCAAMRWLLTRAHACLLVQTSEADPSLHQCATYALHPLCPVPTWLSDHSDGILIADPNTGETSYRSPVRSDERRQSADVAATPHPHPHDKPGIGPRIYTWVDKCDPTDPGFEAMMDEMAAEYAEIASVT